MPLILHRNVATLLAAVALLAASLHAESPVSAYPHARETENPTALDRYVATPDSNFHYEVATTFRGSDYTTYVLSMTSQQWLTEAEVDRPIWTHFLHIVVPDEIQGDSGFLLIGGGRNGKEAPKRASAMVVQFAEATKMICAELQQVPNQPLTFTDDGVGRSEDSIIAYTWDKYLRTGDEKWPLRMPMTKSAVRAMDAVQAFVAQKDIGGHTVKDFIVAGGSKRGWTTWTTGIVDKRAKAIIPLVIDMLNIVPSFEHHWRAYGLWAPAIDDYTKMGIMGWMGSPEYDALMKLVEPYSYRDRLTMPKYLINGTADEFFVTDSSRFYWDDLQQPKYLRYVPNSGHGIANPDVMLSMATFTRAVASGTALPRYAWSLLEDGRIRVETQDKPTAVKLWHATNPEARTFRMDVVGKIWEEEELAPAEDGVYIGGKPAPEKGWTASVIELSYEIEGIGPIRFTTGVKILPETLPFEYKTPEWPADGYIRSKQ
jgi:PhoPQ-activated pathogenicity-related protein